MNTCHDGLCKICHPTAPCSYYPKGADIRVPAAYVGPVFPWLIGMRV